MESVVDGRADRSINQAVIISVAHTKEVQHFIEAKKNVLKLEGRVCFEAEIS